MRPALPHPTPPRPVLVVGGLYDGAGNFDRMKAHLEQRGLGPVRVVMLTPNDGSRPIRELARQVEQAARALLAETGAEELDVVGFSMGALSSRVWIQLDPERPRVRRFVSISGPHAGSALALLWVGAGVRDMRPGSPLLRALDRATWGNTEVHVLYTPFDLMVFPARSARLRGSRSEQTFPVLLHPLMLSDRRVLDAVGAILTAP